MRVFVTGATGYIGQAVVRALVQAGHEVGGLYRSKEKEKLVRDLGAVPIYGNLKDFELYQHFAAESKAVIHTAFESPETERLVAEYLTSALKAEGEEKSLVFTSGVLVLGDTAGASAGETSSTDQPFPLVAWRPAVENYALIQATDHLAVAVIRPGFVYGGGGKSVLASYVQSALKDGAARYIGSGQNHMAYVHRDDLAQLYRVLIETRARGIFHGVDESNVTTAELAKAVSEAAGKKGATRSVPLEEARAFAGPFADAFTLEQRVTSTRSRVLGWTLKHPNILDSVPAAVS